MLFSDGVLHVATVLSLHASAIESLQIDYTCSDPYLVHNPVHHHLIATTLTTQIGILVPDVAGETARAFPTMGPQHLPIPLRLRLCPVIGCVTNRVFVGLPTCHDPALLDAAMAFAQDVPVASQVLRPLVALVATITNKIHTRWFQKLLEPEVERRLREWDARHAGPEATAKDQRSEERNDFLQWTPRQAKASGDPYYMWRPKTLARRILLLNFAAVHTSSFSITNTILDLVSSKPEYITERHHPRPARRGVEQAPWRRCTSSTAGCARALG
ncbi:hypothetical protein DL767_000641 [Monosporascus sp. MG133]|nr:hypothetical protein DL767_000641 [Monosporascus sp. MG133]